MTQRDTSYRLTGWIREIRDVQRTPTHPVTHQAAFIADADVDAFWLDIPERLVRKIRERPEDFVTIPNKTGAPWVKISIVVSLVEEA